LDHENGRVCRKEGKRQVQKTHIRYPNSKKTVPVKAKKAKKAKKEGKEGKRQVQKTHLRYPNSKKTVPVRDS
jgi:hypothetical protein